MEEDVAATAPDRDPSRAPAVGWARLALLYGAVSVVFCVAVGHRMLRARLRPGFRAACSLLLLFMGEPLCAAFAPGAPGLLAFALACLLSYATLPFTAPPSAAGRAVLVTGCESPVGRALARRLAGLGCRVVAGVSASSRAEAGRLAADPTGDLSGDPAVGGPGGRGSVHVLALRPGDARSVSAAEQEVRSLVGADGLWAIAVVTTAAGAADGRAPRGAGTRSEASDVGAYRRALERGLLDPVEVAGAFLPLVRRARGRAVFVGPRPAVEALVSDAREEEEEVVAAAAAAAGLAVFCAALRRRLGSEGTRVCEVEVPFGSPDPSSGGEWDAVRLRGRACLRQDVPADAVDKAPSEGIAEAAAALLCKCPAERYPLPSRALLGHVWAFARRLCGEA